MQRQPDEICLWGCFLWRMLSVIQRRNYVWGTFPPTQVQIVSMRSTDLSFHRRLDFTFSIKLLFVCLEFEVTSISQNSAGNCIFLLLCLSVLCVYLFILMCYTGGGVRPWPQIHHASSLWFIWPTRWTLQRNSHTYTYTYSYVSTSAYWELFVVCEWDCESCSSFSFMIVHKAERAWCQSSEERRLKKRRRYLDNIAGWWSLYSHCMLGKNTADPREYWWGCFVCLVAVS